MPHFLLTNDDGVTSPGLLALIQEMRSLGDVTVLAPDRNWSASGHSKTMHRPLRIRKVRLADDTDAFACDGAPSDCVALAQLGFINDKINLVISGINPNANIGHDITYSGTVTAAMEALIWGIPGVAVSLDSPENHLGSVDYSTAAKSARVVVSTLLRHGYPSGVAINVNVPYCDKKLLKGYKVTRLGLRVYRDALITRQDPRGQPYYWIGGDAPTGVPEEGTDYGAIKDGYVSITPIRLDMSAYNAIEQLKRLDWINSPAGDINET